MKTERLYAITVYLLNHGKTSASELAKQFEVSVRTIQRDIDSLCMAGIPVISLAGAAGGYEISGQFRMDGQFATAEDYSYILTALKGLVSATDDRRAKCALEKIASLAKPDENGILLDFSVLREGEGVLLQLLQEAAVNRRVVSFTYTNNDGECRRHSVEPVAVLYRWYAWYLLAWSDVKQDYRMYKLVRMCDPEVTGSPFGRKHAPAALILQRKDQTDSRQYTDVTVKCAREARARVIEYLKGTVTEELADGSAVMKLVVVENEQLWIGTLLSLGDQVEVLTPLHIRCRLLEAAQKMVSLYQ